MRKFIYFALFSAVILSGCGLLARQRLGPGMGMRRSWDFFRGKFASNGERIFLTATNQDGDIISYTGGPGSGGMMMGAALTCAACHGADGRGGLRIMHMQVTDAPDIRYEALGSGGENHIDDDHGDGHTEYTLGDFRQAVVDGRHPDGAPLSRDMPHWQLEEEDLEDLLEYLKTLP